MSNAIDNLEVAMKRAMAGRPQVGGFPYLADVLRQAGVTRNLWSLPACQSLFLTVKGPVVMQGTPLTIGTSDVQPFDHKALITAIRTDQAGQSSFPEFLAAAWQAGVVSYDVDFGARTVTYHGAAQEHYVESYSPADV